MERPGVWLRRRLASRTKDLFQPPGDARLGEVVLRHLHFHAIAGGQADETLAHLARDMGQDDVLAVVQLDTKHRAGQHCRDAAFDLNGLFFHG